MAQHNHQTTVETDSRSFNERPETTRHQKSSQANAAQYHNKPSRSPETTSASRPSKVSNRPASPEGGCRIQRQAGTQNQTKCDWRTERKTALQSSTFGARQVLTTPIQEHCSTSNLQTHAPADQRTTHKINAIDVWQSGPATQQAGLAIFKAKPDQVDASQHAGRHDTQTVLTIQPKTG